MPASPIPITVAIPTFRGARHLAEAIRSVLRQDQPVSELLVFDDRSDDDTVDIARAEAGGRARIEVNSERLGLAGNWNLCVERAGSPLVAVFHQDDVMRPDHLRRHLQAFAAHPGFGFSCGGFVVIDADGHPVPESAVEGPSLGPLPRFFEPGAFVLELAASNPVRCSSVVLSREAHQKVGGFDPAYRYAVDWEFWVRLAREFPVTWLPEKTVSVRWHQESETHRFRRGTADLDEVRELIGDILSTNWSRWSDASSLRREGQDRLALAYINRAYEALRAGQNRLARLCLRRAWGLSRSLTMREAADPRVMGHFLLSTLRLGREGGSQPNP